MIQGVIERLSKEGAGVLPRPEGKPIEVYNTIPGETVTVSAAKRTKDALRAELVSVDIPSPLRVTPRCPYAGTCGGCKFQHVDYPAQLKFKLDRIREGFEAAGIPCPIKEVEAAADIFYYRNRMDFVFGKDGQLGLKSPGRWWDVLDLSTCFLLSPDSVEIMKRVREWTKKSGLPFWNGETYQGFFRYLVIREGKRTGERMVMLVTAKAMEGAAEKLRELPALLGELATTIVWGINPLITDLSIAEEIIPLKGDPFIFEEAGGIRYKITPNAFFQTNTVMAERLQGVVAGFFGDLKDKTLLDLYCGSGFFSLALAKGAKHTIGIELSAEAIACAKENTKANNVVVEYFVSKAEDFDWSGYAPDAVILDPPRAGLHPKSLEAVLANRPPLIVYVSCNFPRFLEEYKKLSAVYDLADARALDLFPHTPHMECVFKLVRK